MTNPIQVSDSLSNAEEQIERAARIIGRSAARRKVFDAIYHHKSRVKTVGEIAHRSGLSRKSVLIAGKLFSKTHIVRQTKKDTDTAYEKIDFFHVHKKEILRAAGNRKELAKIPTKRKVVVTVRGSVTIPATGANVRRITIDDVDSFAKVGRIRTTTSLPSSVSEKQFRLGVQAVVGERGSFKDWGGEKSDFYTTRLIVNGKRRTAAFAFKGPGQKGKLVPGKMGKNGDQMPRLFQEEADVFLVQHWQEIDASVVDLMWRIAVAKSVTSGRQIQYGIIDGQDSERLRLAYPSEFASKIRTKRHR